VFDRDYEGILKETQIVLEDMDAEEIQKLSLSKASLQLGQKAFGYTQEDLKTLMSPMAVTGQEAIGSMGTDTPISAISNKKKLLYTYFKQNFAQVTNPPIDPIREESVMSLVSFIGPRPNIFDNKALGNVKRLEVKQPVLTNEDMQKIRKISEIGDNHFVSRVLDTTFEKGAGFKGFSNIPRSR
jgi:glutamate synthase (NADPH/NADH) large chain